MRNQINFLLQQAVNCFQQGNVSQAKLLSNKVLKLQPKNFHALHIMGVSLGIENKHDEACDFLLRAVKINPYDSHANFNLARALSETGNDLASIKYHQMATGLTPESPEAWLNFGKSLYQLHRHDEALSHYEKALQLKPDYIEAWLNKGNTLNELKRYDEALAHYDKALSLKPDYAEAWLNKGNTLNELKRYDEALAHYDKALSLKPDYAEAWLNKGNTLNELKRYDEALAHYDKALSLRPDYAEVWFNKGNTLNALKRYDEALSHYEQAIQSKPSIDWALGDWLNLKMKICSWSGVENSFDLIAKKLIGGEKVITPFPLLSLTDDGLLHKKSSEIYVRSRYPFNSVLGPILKRPNSQKIRVGYFSADFRNHPVSLLTAEIFELHDKDRFEIIAFSFGADDGSEIRSRLNKAFHQFIDVSAMSDMEIAKLARDLHIDIAVDLTGHTQYSRSGTFSYRAAPIQISYIGYLGTMGAEYYDYLLADKTIITDNSRKFYSEKIIYLPSYQANDRKRVISERQFTRAELGLPDSGFIFCCFNNNYKISPSTFDSWVRILNAVKGSVLFLYADNEWSKANLIKEAGLRGVDSARLVFGKRITPKEYLARYRVCNLFLDTFPYNAGTTASDALWAGLPILTLMGQSFASRIAASLLNAIGLPELITNSQEEYEALAIETANNIQKLDSIKQKLTNNRSIAPLFDTPRFTKNLEVAYIKMYENYQAGIEPNDMFI